MSNDDDVYQRKVYLDHSNHIKLFFGVLRKKNRRKLTTETIYEII